MSITFDEEPFAEGRFRRAYMGVYTTPKRRRGEQCVVKEMSEEYMWSAIDWKMTLDTNKVAQDLAEDYNTWLSHGRYSGRCTFTDVEIWRVTRCSSGSTLNVGEYTTVEEYLPGRFQKFCNNYGYIAPGAQNTIMPAFMHWSWWHTGGQTMIADLQGVRNRSSFRLTDPAILSTNGQYGVTDMGVEGMCMFFLNHQCNRYCSGLPCPTARDVMSKIPPAYLATCTALIDQLQNATSYTHELQLPAHLRAIVCTTLAEVAARQPY